MPRKEEEEAMILFVSDLCSFLGVEVVADETPTHTPPSNISKRPITGVVLTPKVCKRRSLVRSSQSLLYVLCLFPLLIMASCDSTMNNVDLLGLRIASLFIIGVASLLGALFPILTKRSKWLKVPPGVFE